MFIPHIHISKRERRKYTSNVAAWKVIREEGIVRFIAVRGILFEGVPVVTVIAVAASFFQNDFRLDTGFLTDPWIIIFSAIGMVVWGAGSKFEEWRENEEQYKAWRRYKNKGNILNIEKQ